MVQNDIKLIDKFNAKTENQFSKHLDGKIPCHIAHEPVPERLLLLQSVALCGLEAYCSN
jgi:hypothetical protein